MKLSCDIYEYEHGAGAPVGLLACETCGRLQNNDCFLVECRRRWVRVRSARHWRTIIKLADLGLARREKSATPPSTATSTRSG